MRYIRPIAVVGAYGVLAWSVSTAVYQPLPPVPGWLFWVAAVAVTVAAGLIWGSWWAVNPTRGAPKPEPPPDPAAIRRGEGHEIAFRIVEEGGGWRIDTDLLRILVERLGSLEEVVRPLSEQVG